MAIIMTGGADAFSLAAYGLPSTETVEFIRGQMSSLQNLAAPVQGFMDSIVESFREWDSGEVAAKAARVLGVVNTVYSQDSVFAITDVEAFLTTTAANQYYLMADPYLRQMVHDGRMSAFEGYVDSEPDSVGIQHTAYRDAIRGVLVEEEDEVIYRNFYDDPERELTLEQKVAIADNWSFARYMIEVEKKSIT